MTIQKTIQNIVVVLIKRQQVTTNSLIHSSISSVPSDSNGNFITKWGTPGSCDGQFEEPTGIATLDSSGNIYVADRGNARIQVFTLSVYFISIISTIFCNRSDIFGTRNNSTMDQ